MGGRKKQRLNNFNGLTWPQNIKKFFFFFSWDLSQSPLRSKEGFPPIPMCTGSGLSLLLPYCAIWWAAVAAHITP